MSFTIRTEKNPAIDMIYRAYGCVNEKDSGKDERSAFEQDWQQHFCDTITSFEMHDLQLVFSTLIIRVMLFSVISTSGIYRPDELIERLEAMSEEEFLDQVKHVIRIEPEKRDWLHGDMIVEALERDWAELSIDFSAEAKQLVSLLSSAAYFRNRLIEVLSWFNEKFISPYEDRILVLMEDHIREYQQRFRDDSDMVIDAFTNGNSGILDPEKTVILYPITADSPDISIYMPDDIHMIYGIDHAVKLLETSKSERTDILVKAVSDPKRLEILRLLRQRTWYGREIAQELKLTPATVSYHVDILFQAGLIRIQRPEGRRFYYTINERGIHELISCLEYEFLT